MSLMCPFLDLANHSLAANAEWVHREEDERLGIASTRVRPCSPPLHGAPKTFGPERACAFMIASLSTTA